MPDSVLGQLMMAVMVLLFFAGLYLWFVERSGQSPYKNKLRLRALHQIPEMRPKKVPVLFGADDEFSFIVDMFEDWYRERKSLAPYVEDEAHREALRNDLLDLKRRAEIEITAESKKPVDEQSPAKFIQTRKDFIEHGEYQLGQLEKWRKLVSNIEQITLEALNGRAEIVRSGEQEAISLTLFLPAGSYRVTIQRDGQEALSEESDGESRYDFVKAGIGAIRNGEAVIEDMQGGKRERVPFW